jgi:predicted nuclease with TOPRIM domain
MDIPEQFGCLLSCDIDSGEFGIILRILHIYFRWDNMEDVLKIKKNHPIWTLARNINDLDAKLDGLKDRIIDRVAENFNESFKQLKDDMSALRESFERMDDHIKHHHEYLMNLLENINSGLDSIEKKFGTNK